MTHGKLLGKTWIKNETKDFRLIYRVVRSLSNPPASIHAQKANDGGGTAVPQDFCCEKHERKSVILTETGLLFPEKIVFYIENIRGRSRPFDPAPSASMFSE
jgi:hypothetical protein